MGIIKFATLNRGNAFQIFVISLPKNGSEIKHFKVFRIPNNIVLVRPHDFELSSQSTCPVYNKFFKCHCVFEKSMPHLKPANFRTAQGLISGRPEMICRCDADYLSSTQWTKFERVF